VELEVELAWDLTAGKLIVGWTIGMTTCNTYSITQYYTEYHSVLYTISLSTIQSITQYYTEYHSVLYRVSLSTIQSTEYHSVLYTISLSTIHSITNYWIVLTWPVVLALVVLVEVLLVELTGAEESSIPRRHLTLLASISSSYALSSSVATNPDSG